MAHLIDTNVLLRQQQPDSSDCFAAIKAVSRLSLDGERLCVARQNLIEFRNTATRPIDKNGLGLSPIQADLELDIAEKGFYTLAEDDKVYTVWRALIAAKGVSGRQVHDAWLVAFMLVYGVTHILTFNGSDFQRYTALPPEIGVGIVVVSPKDIV